MKFEPTFVPDDWEPPTGGEVLHFRPDDGPPRLTAEEAERGIVLVRGDDGLFYVADTVVDPATGGVIAVAKPGAKGNRIEIAED